MVHFCIFSQVIAFQKTYSDLKIKVTENQIHPRFLVAAPILLIWNFLLQLLHLKDFQKTYFDLEVKVTENQTPSRV